MMHQVMSSTCQQGLDDFNLLYLPGAAGNTAFWQPVLSRLEISAQHTVLAYPSFAGQAAHPKVQCFEDLQRYVLAQIPEQTVIVAQSMGGIFAVQAARQQPQKVRALVLVATSGGIDLTPFDAQDWREQYLHDFDVPDWFATTPSDAVHTALQQLHCPVLLIWGDQDPISPVAVGQYLAQQLQHAELHVIAGGQHDLAAVHADEVSALIQAFLQRIGLNAQLRLDRKDQH